MATIGEKRFVYIIESIPTPGRFYTGLTADFDERLADHNAGRSPHTSGGRPWETSVVIEFKSEATAVAFERCLKSGSGVAFSKKHLRAAGALPARVSRSDAPRGVRLIEPIR